jgi:hypothetical protein
MSRWPSVRPDTIVEESVYNHQKHKLKSRGKVDPKSLTVRVPWERGLHQNYTGQSFMLLLIQARVFRHLSIRQIRWPTLLRKYGYGPTLA